MGKVVVVDYGVGNLYSLMAALNYLGLDPKVDTDGSLIKECDVAVIPGVARFGTAIDALHARGQAVRLLEAHGEGRRLVGLCLGAQLFLESSDESPGKPGLGIIGGIASRLKPRHEVVPNQGWHRLMRANASAETCVDDALWLGRYFYFSHSFRIKVDDPRMQFGTILYGGESVTALYESGNVVGMQFHPELSGEAGLRLLGATLRQGRL